MTNSRQHIRRPANIDVEFETTETGNCFSIHVVAKGRVINISEGGFCLTTNYPLRIGQMITVKEALNGVNPSYGHVNWTKEEIGQYRAGLNFKFP